VRAIAEPAEALNAPQPLEPWSRAVWLPVVQNFGEAAFEQAAADNRSEPGMRIRALEILTDAFDGVSSGTAATCARADSPWVRARTAWAIAVKPPDNFNQLALGLARDNASQVRVAALDALVQRQNDLDLVTRQQALAANLAHPDVRVRQAAARLAAGLPDPAWLALWRQQQASGAAQSRLTTALALQWRERSSIIKTSVVDTALAVLAATRAHELQEQALRLIYLGLGDYHLEHPSTEMYTAYESSAPLTELGALTRRLQKTVGALLPSGNAEVDAEAARLLAVIQADDPGLPAKVMARCTRVSTATSDFHYLIVLSRLKTSPATNLTAQVAGTLLGLDQKLSASGLRPGQAWSERFEELARALVRQEPKLADALGRHPDLARPAHLGLVPLLGSDRYLPSARLFLNAAQRQPSFPWSIGLIDLLSALPPEETHAVFRRQLSNVTLRERLLRELAVKPEADDRPHYLAGLGSPTPEVARASMSALLVLPTDPSGRTTTAALRLLRSLLPEPNGQTARAQALALLTKQSGQKFTVQERSSDLTGSYQPVFDWFAARNPSLVQQLDADDQDTAARWEPVLRSAQWANGKPPRGETLYHERGCQSCHEGPHPLGPDLHGVAQRLGPADLIRAILFPSRDVAPAYRMTTFRTRSGQTHSGLIAFESADGVILRAGADVTLRLAEADIVGREPSTVSFMPGGLLAGLGAQDLADLAAYLKRLTPP
jgi:putative heme-binding domain-containing protein